MTDPNPNSSCCGEVAITSPSDGTAEPGEAEPAAGPPTASLSTASLPTAGPSTASLPTAGLPTAGLPTAGPQRVESWAEQDAHEFFRTWRPVSPLLEVPNPNAPIDILMVTRHCDAIPLLTDPRTRQFETEVLEFRGITGGALHEFMANVMLASNPPVHAQRRAPLSRAFAFKLMDAWRPQIRALAGELIADAKAKSGASDQPIAFTTDVASQVPPRIVASVLGLDDGDVDHFLSIVRVASRGLSSFPDELFPGIETAFAELKAYVAAQITHRRAAPRDDLLSAYVQTVDAGETLTEAETLAQIAGVILAGSDTTRTAITVMMSQLLQHPDQWAMVCADPDSHAQNTALEALRYEPPVGSIPRITLEDIQIGDRVAPAGRVVSISVLSALRDPGIIANPDAFDITRSDIPRWLLTFGGGAHRCLGEALARAEMEETLIAATQNLADAKLHGPPPTMAGSVGIRDIGELTLMLA